MATRILSSQNLRKLASFTLQNISQRQLISPYPPAIRSTIASPNKFLSPLYLSGLSLAARWATYGSVNLVLSDDGKPKFQIEEVEPSTKRRYLTKKRLKVQRKKEKKKRKEANKKDPRRIRPKGKKIKQKFPTPEARLKYKIEKAKLKEARLVEKLKKYEVAKAQGPMAKPDAFSGEERFYLKKVSQKKSNYVPVGRRGVFGGVILNMHLHWKKNETVKVICKPCKPGQIQEFANEIARLSGGIPVNIIGDDTIVFYQERTMFSRRLCHLLIRYQRKRHLKNQNMNSRWRQFGVSLQYLKRSLSFVIGMLHFMEIHNPRKLILFVVMIEKLRCLKWGDWIKGRTKSLIWPPIIFLISTSVMFLNPMKKMVPGPAGINDEKEHAEELAELLRTCGGGYHVNLIPYNPIEGSEYKRPYRKVVQAFVDALEGWKDNRQCSTDPWACANAACGQLRNEFQKNPLLEIEPSPSTEPTLVAA